MPLTHPSKSYQFLGRGGEGEGEEEEEEEQEEEERGRERSMGFAALTGTRVWEFPISFGRGYGPFSLKRCLF